MTLDEKVGQMTQPDQMYLAAPSDVATYHLGSLLSGGDSDPKSSNSFADWRAMIDGYHAEAAKSRLKIPLLYGVDAVHGHNNVVGAVVFPHDDRAGRHARRGARRGDRPHHGEGGPRHRRQLDLRALRDGAARRALGPQLRGLRRGPDARARSWGRPRCAASRARTSPTRCACAACAKHYVGDGGTAWGTGAATTATRQGRPPRPGRRAGWTKPTLRRIHLAPYADAIAAGVATIMPSYSSWNGEKCSGSKRLLTEILKDELGFQGFLISDYAAIDQLPGDYRSDVKQSIGAGMDMVMVPQKYQEFIATLKSLVEAGEVDKARIDDAVRRILRVKFAMGLKPGARAALGRRAAGRASARPSTAPWRGARCASRWCC